MGIAETTTYPRIGTTRSTRSLGLALGERARTQAGFTLLELLVTVAILGVLSGVSVMSVGHIRQRAQVVALDQSLRAVATAAEAQMILEGLSDFRDIDRTRLQVKNTENLQFTLGDVTAESLVLQARYSGSSEPCRQIRFPMEATPGPCTAISDPTEVFLGPDADERERAAKAERDAQAAARKEKPAKADDDQRAVQQAANSLGEGREGDEKLRILKDNLAQAERELNAARAEEEAIQGELDEAVANHKEVVVAIEKAKASYETAGKDLEKAQKDRNKKDIETAKKRRDEAKQTVADLETKEKALAQTVADLTAKHDESTKRVTAAQENYERASKELDAYLGATAEQKVKRDDRTPADRGESKDNNQMQQLDRQDDLNSARSDSTPAASKGAKGAKGAKG